MERDPRRLAMLREMGIRLWLPPQAEAAAPASVEQGPEAAGAGLAAPVGTPAAPRTVEVRRAPMAPAVQDEPRETGGLVALTALLPEPGPESLVRGAAATMGWDELREAVAGCRACGLCRGRRQAVFGVGNAQADWMIVGEAPGEQEDLRGEPFVGPSGELLDQMLRAIGLGREPGPPERQVFIANVIKCRPPNNRNPDPAEVLQCEPYLKRQVELVRPKIILAMGRFAVQSLLRSTEPIGRLRGRVHRYAGVPVIVTYHPAYLLRSLPEKAKAWEDLCLALDTAQGA